MKHLEAKYIEHKGIKVLVLINYHLGRISLSEHDPDGRNGRGDFTSKNWVFSEREIEYMPGWLNILEAMAFAIKQAQKDLKEHQDAEDKKKQDLMLAIGKEDLKKKRAV